MSGRIADGVQARHNDAGLFDAAGSATNLKDAAV
jgi:hypothetical protein